MLAAACTTNPSVTWPEAILGAVAVAAVCGMVAVMFWVLFRK